MIKITIQNEWKDKKLKYIAKIIHIWYHAIFDFIIFYMLKYDVKAKKMFLKISLVPDKANRDKQILKLINNDRKVSVWAS